MIVKSVEGAETLGELFFGIVDATDGYMSNSVRKEIAKVLRFAVKGSTKVGSGHYLEYGVLLQADFTVTYDNKTFIISAMRGDTSATVRLAFYESEDPNNCHQWTGLKGWEDKLSSLLWPGRKELQKALRPLKTTGQKKGKRL